MSGSGRQAPTGRVLFMVNGAVVGEATSVVTGSATAVAVFRVAAVPRGTHAVTAVYLGDSTYRAGTATATLSVN